MEWTTVALIAIGAIVFIYLVGFILFGFLWKSMNDKFDRF